MVSTTDDPPSIDHRNIVTNGSQGNSFTYDSSTTNTDSLDIASDAIISAPGCVELEDTKDKKYKDMMRKRRLRQSSEYRQQETGRARDRMKLRRSDPSYRDKERDRDRERRRIARRNNPERRAVERERDRLYKKRLRDDDKIDFLVNGVSHEILLIDSSCTHTMVIEPTVVKQSG